MNLLGFGVLAVIAPVEVKAKDNKEIKNAGAVYWSSRVELIDFGSMVSRRQLISSREQCQ